MLAFLSFIGILGLIALAIFSFFVLISKERKTEFIPKKDVWDQDRERVIEEGLFPKLAKYKSKKFLLVPVVSVLLVLSLSNFLFYYANQGYQYYLVYPTGGWDTEFNTGFKFRWFATLQEWQKEIDCKVVAEGEPAEGIEGIISDKTTFVNEGKQTQVVPGIPITFIDRVSAAVRISTRMKMPTDPKAFRDIAESFRTQPNLIYGTMIPTIKEQISNIGYQYTAQDYISGAATNFRQATEDQLKYGGYVTESVQLQDTVYSDFQSKDPGSIKEINTKYKIIRRTDKSGKLLRIEHELTKNKIEVTQVIVEAVVPEPAFQQRLEAQRDISAQKRIEMEKIETAKAAQQRIIAEGERDKAEERVSKEKEQVGALIAIETQLKQESTKKQLAEIALQTARLESEQNLVRERAQAEANRLKVAAGLTPQEKSRVGI